MISTKRQSASFDAFVLLPLVLFLFQCIVFGPQRFFVEAVSYTLTIPPYQEECFLLLIPTYDWKIPRRLIGNYELVNDGSNPTVTADPVLAYVMKVVDYHETVLWSQVGVARGNFNVKIPVGSNAPKRYWMCIQNSDIEPHSELEEQVHPDHEIRTVGFSYRFIPDNDAAALLLEELKAAPSWEEENIQDWRKRSVEIEEDLRTFVSHHDYLKIRESTHRTLVEKTFANVLQYTVAEAVMVILVSVGQVMYFRRFLESKRYIR